MKDEAYSFQNENTHIHTHIRIKENNFHNHKKG